jgi:hypothetical protein
MVDIRNFLKITLLFTITAQYQQKQRSYFVFCVNHVYFKEILFYIPIFVWIINSNTLEKNPPYSLMFFHSIYSGLPRYFTFFE